MKKVAALLALSFLLCVGCGQTQEEIPVISLEEFEQILDTAAVNEDVLVYVGRDSCPTCTVVYPLLKDVVNENELNLLYYSTEPDRDERPEAMNAFLKTVGVDYVPKVVAIQNGEVKEAIDGEEFISMYGKSIDGEKNNEQ